MDGLDWNRAWRRGQSTSLVAIAYELFTFANDF